MIAPAPDRLPDQLQALAKPGGLWSDLVLAECRQPLAWTVTTDVSPMSAGSPHIDRADPAGVPIERTPTGSGSMPSMKAAIRWLATSWNPPTPIIIAMNTAVPTAMANDWGVRGFAVVTHPE